MKIRNNFIKNGIASVLQKGVRVAEQLLLVPFFISAWGVEYYGDWLTITIIPSVLAFADLGFGTAASNSFVLAFVGGKYKEAEDYSKTGIHIIFRLIVAGILLCTIILGAFYFFLVNDLGKKVGCGAYLKKLQRSSIGHFEATNALELDYFKNILYLF